MNPWITDWVYGTNQNYTILQSCPRHWLQNLKLPKHLTWPMDKIWQRQFASTRWSNPFRLATATIITLVWSLLRCVPLLPHCTGLHWHCSALALPGTQCLVYRVQQLPVLCNTDHCPATLPPTCLPCTGYIIAITTIIPYYSPSANVCQPKILTV